jgi:hypothetical protein
MERLAKTVLLAMKYREESYNHAEAAEALEKAATKAREIYLEALGKGEIYEFNPSNILKMVDFNKFYVLSIEESADRAANDMGYDCRANEPIRLLLTNSWNESMIWAASCNAHTK